MSVVYKQVACIEVSMYPTGRLHARHCFFQVIYQIQQGTDISRTEAMRDGRDPLLDFDCTLWEIRAFDIVNGRPEASFRRDRNAMKRCKESGQSLCNTHSLSIRPG